MSILPRNLSSFFRSVSASVKYAKQVTIKRNVQTFTQNLSTVPALKIQEPFVDKISENEFNFETFGTSRPKIEVDGMMLNWDVVGDGEHVILMLPGSLGTIQADFGPLLPKMDMKKYTIVSWDPPGYGRSRPPSKDFTGVHHRVDAHIVVKLMDKLGFDKYSMMGWSGGTTTGIFIASEYPSKVNRFVTISGMAYADQRIVDLTKDLVHFDKWNPKMLAPLLEIYEKEYLLQLVRDWYGSLCDYHYNNVHAPIKENVPKIKCPTLIVHGGQDPVAGMEHADFLHNNIRNSKLSIIPKGAHNLHLRYTDEFLNLATQFLES